MEQLLAHLVGDYILQSHDMATKKVKSSLWAFYHAMTYTLPFLFLTVDPLKLGLIFGSHFLIDRFRLVKFIIIWKNALFGSWINENNYLTETGYPKGTPAWLSVWLLIIADNTIHLLINYIII